MFSQSQITQFKNYRAANIERDMGGVTTGPIAALRGFFLLVATWGSLFAGLGCLYGILKSVGASSDIALISFYAFLLFWLGFCFTDLHSRLVDWVVDFFEGGILPKGVRCFGQPAVSEFHSTFTDYHSPVLGVPTSPPRRLA